MRSITTRTLVLALGLTACTTDKDTDTDTAATSNVTVGDTTTGGGTTAEATTSTTTTTPTTTGATETGTTGSTTEEPGMTTTTTTEPGTTTTGEPETTTGGTTDGTTGGVGDESPYNACKTAVDCAMGSFCINAAVTMDAVKGNFCSPACDGDMCPDPGAGVNAMAGAQCLFGADPMMPSNCAVVCVVGKDDCGPTSDCEDIGIPPQMGQTFGVCSHPA